MYKTLDQNIASEVYQAQRRAKNAMWERERIAGDFYANGRPELDNVGGLPQLLSTIQKASPPHIGNRVRRIEDHAKEVEESFGYNVREAYRFRTGKINAADLQTWYGSLPRDLEVTRAEVLDNRSQIDGLSRSISSISRSIETMKDSVGVRDYLGYFFTSNKYNKIRQIKKAEERRDNLVEERKIVVGGYVSSVIKEEHLSRMKGEYSKASQELFLHRVEEPPPISDKRPKVRGLVEKVKRLFF